MTLRTLFLSGALVCTVALSANGARAQGFQLIVNGRNPVDNVTTETAAAFFLKKTITWPDGETVRPVDLGTDHPVRDTFSHTVLHKTVSLVKTFWQQQVFRGRDVPPPELRTVNEVLEFVRRHAGAVGYVPDTVRVGPGVRVLRLGSAGL